MSKNYHPLFQSFYSFYQSIFSFFKNKYVLVSLTLINIILIVLNIYSQDSWILKLDNQSLMSVTEFENDYNAFVDFQSLSQPLANKKEIQKIKNSQKQKRLYFQNLLNDLLIVQFSQKNKIFNPKKLNANIQNISEILKRLTVKRIYIQKLIIPKLKKIDDNLVATYFNELSKSEKTKKWSVQKRKKNARQQAKIKQLQLIYLENIEKLRSKYRIKINNGYLDSLK